MLCKNPYVDKGQAHGCGQCLPCRINRRRVWTHRMILESMSHSSSTFVTLTYAPEHIPQGHIDKKGHEYKEWSLNPKHVQDFMKRLRKAYAPLKLRQYIVGEYGEDTYDKQGNFSPGRPHFHIALFGYPFCHNRDLEGKPIIGYKKVSLEKNGLQYWKINQCKCPPCTMIQEKWDYGFTQNGTLTIQAAGYCAGYMTKKFTNTRSKCSLGTIDDPCGICVACRINKKEIHPEFARMSNRPGIGALSVEAIAELLDSEFGSEYVAGTGDVPLALSYGKKKMPLGSYIREKLREEMLWKETKTPKNILQKLREEALEEVETFFWEKVADNPKYRQILKKKYRVKELDQKTLILEINEQKRLNYLKRFNLFKKGKTL